MSSVKESVEIYTENEVIENCDHQKIPMTKIYTFGFVYLMILFVLFLFEFGDLTFTMFITGAIVNLIDTYPHEHLHNWAFKRNEYDSEIRYFPFPPHVLAEKQHIDSSTWERMELAPLLGLGYVYLFYTTGFTAIFGFDPTEILAFTFVILSLHIVSCLNDLFLYFE